jgi:hypothetical protein
LRDWFEKGIIKSDLPNRSTYLFGGFQWQYAKRVGIANIVLQPVSWAGIKPVQIAAVLDRKERSFIWPAKATK